MPNGSIRQASIDDPHFTPPQKHRWQDDALCTQVDPEMFFPGKGGSTVDAKALCISCDVTMKCLEYTLKGEKGGKYRFGVSGGLAERERRALAKLLVKYHSMTLEAGYNEIVRKRGTKGKKRSKVGPQNASQELQAL